MTDSISGLSEKHRHEARHRTVQAAVLALAHAPQVHYSQGPKRWEGINKHLVATHGAYPSYADCSSFATWCLWNGMFIPFAIHDVVNGARWQAGYTGTMYRHGKMVVHESNIKWGDLALYGAAPGHHVAVCVGGGEVISHGSEGAPFRLPLHYRSDLHQIRRFI